ncbi:MAG: histidine kinase [Gemmatimonadota bacterium]|nr:MAG: histidine kinase [Gemmatimonadota bacterium]
MKSPQATIIVLFLLQLSIGVSLSYSISNSATTDQEPYEAFSFDLHSNEVKNVRGWRYHFGDHPEWAQLNYNDSLWMKLPYSPGVQDKTDGIRWYRAPIFLFGEQDDYDVLALYFRLLGISYEVYWDGELLDHNGHVSQDPSQEIPGGIRKIVKLKREFTTPGRHLLAIRLSRHFKGQTYRIFSTQFGYFSGIQSNIHTHSNLLYWEGGLFLLASLFTLALYLGSHKRSYLLFAVFCFLNLCYTAYGILQYEIDMNTQSFDILLLLFHIGKVLLYSTLNIFFILHFDIPYKHVHVCSSIIVTLVIRFVLGSNLIALSTLYSLALLLYATRYYPSESILSMLGVSIFSFSDIAFLQNIFPGTYLVAGELLFLFCIIFAISKKIRKQDQLHEEAIMKTARMETELLKRHIQPHFIMNTLLSIVSWLSENPKKAALLIHSLANEFRVIHEISSKKEIPLQREIALCESHLRLMGFRKDATYTLTTRNLCQEEAVPPMIFHTLIENALTHAYEPGENGSFTLICEKNKKKIQYTLQNDGSRLKKLKEKSAEQIDEGMGMKYVRARLQESYPHKCQIRYGFKDGNWEVIIVISK